MKKLEDSLSRYGLVGGAIPEGVHTEADVLNSYNEINAENLSLERFNKILFTPFYSARKLSTVVDLGIFSATVLLHTPTLVKITKRFVEGQPHISSITVDENGVDCFTEFSSLRGIVNLAAVAKGGDSFGVIRIIRTRSCLHRGFSAWRGEIGSNRSLIFLRLLYCYVLLTPEIFGLSEIFHNRPYSIREEVFTKFDMPTFSTEAQQFLDKIACSRTSVEPPTDRQKEILQSDISRGMLTRAHERNVLLERFGSFDEIKSQAVSLLSGVE